MRACARDPGRMTYIDSSTSSTAMIMHLANLVVAALSGAVLAFPFDVRELNDGALIATVTVFPASCSLPSPSTAVGPSTTFTNTSVTPTTQPVSVPRVLPRSRSPLPTRIRQRSRRRSPTRTRRRSRPRHSSPTRIPRRPRRQRSSRSRQSMSLRSPLRRALSPAAARPRPSVFRPRRLLLWRGLLRAVGRSSPARRTSRRVLSARPRPFDGTGPGEIAQVMSRHLSLSPMDSTVLLQLGQGLGSLDRRLGLTVQGLRSMQLCRVAVPDLEGSRSSQARSRLTTQDQVTPSRLPSSDAWHSTTIQRHELGATCDSRLGLVPYLRGLSDRSDIWRVVLMIRSSRDAPGPLATSCRANIAVALQTRDADTARTRLGPGRLTVELPMPFLFRRISPRSKFEFPADKLRSSLFKFR
ncbi:hypothetical protein C8Q80DRAFT_1356611, partial [Daedaleopsis nitida]